MTEILTKRALYSEIQLDYGAIFEILMSSEARNLRLSSIYAQVTTPVKLRQTAVEYDENGNAVGFVTWAFITSKVLDEIRNSGDRLLHPSEWNEGDHLHFVDFYAKKNKALQLARTVIGNSFAGQKIGTFTRRGSIRSITIRKNFIHDSNFPKDV